MALIGNSSKIIEERQYLREGETELTERQFNLVIGGVLLWGFLMNYLMVTLFSNQIMNMVASTGAIGFLIGYLVLVIVGSVMIGRGGAAMSFVGYNLIALPIGVVVCASVQGVPVGLVQSAVLVTAIVTLTSMILATIFPGFFLSMGRAIGISLLVAIIAELLSMLLFHRNPIIYEWLFVGMFSMYVGYDWARANTCARTLDNAVDLAASLYLDIMNLFLRILEIMARSKKR